jgi:hypothetical protein
MEILITALLIAMTVGAGFEVPLPLGEMIADADVIVVGTIRGASKETFTLHVEEVLAGELRARSIHVEKFPADAASPRWAPYACGQTVVLFLDATPAPRFRILGRIGEGEIPLDPKHAYFHGRYLGFLAPDWYEVHGRRIHIQRFDRALTLDAIRNFNKADARYGSRSNLHEFLAKEKAGSRSQ